MSQGFYLSLEGFFCYTMRTFVVVTSASVPNKSNNEGQRMCLTKASKEEST